MSGIDRDVRRFRQIGEDRRMDLKEFIKQASLGDDIKVPIRIIDLPSFEYDQRSKGGIGKGDAEEGDIVDTDEEGDEDSGEPGDETTEHEYYEMDPEEFARELDEELGLEFENKGQKVVETEEGDYNETRRAGPESTLDKDHLVKEAIKRHSALYVDEEYIKEVLKVEGYGIEKVYKWARKNSLNVSKTRVENLYRKVPSEHRTNYKSIEDIDKELRRKPPRSSYKNMGFRSDDERYRSPETVEKPQHNAVIINIRDVSGSMRSQKQELVERVFTPLDWYLQGKYDNVEFVYIAHDSQAWEVDRDEFFGIRSGGGTRVSSAFELVKEEILSEYPWNSWNRFIFAAGDGENSSNDTKQQVVPLMENISANRQAYVQVQPNGPNTRREVGQVLEDELDDDDQYRIKSVNNKSDVLDSIRYILDTINEE